MYLPPLSHVPTCHTDPWVERSLSGKARPHQGAHAEHVSTNEEVGVCDPRACSLPQHAALLRPISSTQGVLRPACKMHEEQQLEISSDYHQQFQSHMRKEGTSHQRGNMLQDGTVLVVTTAKAGFQNFDSCSKHLQSSGHEVTLPAREGGVGLSCTDLSFEVDHQLLTSSPDLLNWVEEQQDMMLHVSSIMDAKLIVLISWRCTSFQNQLHSILR